MSTNNYAAAVRGYRDELGAAMQYADADLVPEAVATRKRARVHAARRALLAARPALPQSLPTRDGVMASLRPRNADEIARVQHEAAKVQALLDKGRSLGQIIANADETRALAIADMIETLPATLESQSGDEIIAEVRGLVFDRLADLGVEAATSVRDAEQQHAPALAWHRAMSEAADGSDASIAAWQDVYRADPEGYEAIRGGLDGTVDAWIQRLGFPD